MEGFHKIRVLVTKICFYRVCFVQKQIVQDIKARSVAESHDGKGSSQNVCHQRECDDRACDHVLQNIQKHTKNHEKLIKNTIQSFRKNRK